MAHVIRRSCDPRPITSLQVDAASVRSGPTRMGDPQERHAALHRVEDLGGGGLTAAPALPAAAPLAAPRGRTRTMPDMTFVEFAAP